MTRAWLEELSFDESLALLQSHDLGRLALIVNEFPIIVPVNYRLVDAGARNWIALRARSGGIVEQGTMNVAFQIDGIDRVRRRGWSVLARGTLHRVDPDAAGFRERFDPDPWISEDRDAWMVVEPFQITGRRLRRTRVPPPFDAQAYL